MTTVIATGDDKFWFHCRSCFAQGKSRLSLQRAEIDAENHDCTYYSAERQLRREESIRDAQAAIQAQLERQRNRK